MQNVNARTQTYAYKLFSCAAFKKKKRHRGKVCFTYFFLFGHSAINHRANMAARAEQVTCLALCLFAKEIKALRKIKRLSRRAALSAREWVQRELVRVASRSRMMPLSLALSCQEKLPSNSCSTVPPPDLSTHGRTYRHTAESSDKSFLHSALFSSPDCLRCGVQARL